MTLHLTGLGPDLRINPITPKSTPPAIFRRTHIQGICFWITRQFEAQRSAKPTWNFPNRLWGFRATLFQRSRFTWFCWEQNPTFAASSDWAPKFACFWSSESADRLALFGKLNSLTLFHLECVVDRFITTRQSILGPVFSKPWSWWSPQEECQIRGNLKNERMHMEFPSANFGGAS